MCTEAACVGVWRGAELFIGNELLVKGRTRAGKTAASFAMLHVGLQSNTYAATVAASTRVRPLLVQVLLRSRQRVEVDLSGFADAGRPVVLWARCEKAPPAFEQNRAAFDVVQYDGSEGEAVRAGDIEHPSPALLLRSECGSRSPSAESYGGTRGVVGRTAKGEAGIMAGGAEGVPVVRRAGSRSSREWSASDSRAAGRLAVRGDCPSLIAVEVHATSHALTLDPHAYPALSHLHLDVADWQTSTGVWSPLPRQLEHLHVQNRESFFNCCTTPPFIDVASCTALKYLNVRSAGCTLRLPHTPVMRVDNIHVHAVLGGKRAVACQQYWSLSLNSNQALLT